MERPIIMTAESINAIRDGRKTMTRRVIKPQPLDDCGPLIGPEWYEPTIIDRYGEMQPGKPIFGAYDEDGNFGVKCPWQPGDTLWVRETWCNEWRDPEGYTGKYLYKADGNRVVHIDSIEKSPWKPSIHMPRKAARIFLTAKSVTVERLHDITEADAIAEGATWFGYPKEEAQGVDFRTCIGGFAYLWDKINAKRGHPWSANDWVWAIEFERRLAG